jgi:predicted phage terminase large subunit-like protein
VDNLTRMLAGYDVRRNRVTKAKEVRARPFSAQVEAGNVKLVRGPWNKAFLDELEQFPDPDDKAKDDQVDASSGAFNALSGEVVQRVRSL